MPEPAWYPDPDGSRRLRWWDGSQWTDHTAIPDEPSPAAWPGPRGAARPGPPGAGLPDRPGPAGPGGPGPAWPGAGTPPPRPDAPAGGPPSRPPSPSFGPPMSPPAGPPVGPPPGTFHGPLPGPAPVGYHDAAPRRSGSLPDVGRWLETTFALVGARLRALVAVAVATLVPALLVNLLVVAVVLFGDTAVDGDGEFTGAGSGELARGLGIASTVLAALGSLVAVGAVAHLVRHQLRGHQAPADRSLRWGIRRAPRVLGWGLAVVAAGAAVAAAVVVAAVVSPFTLLLTVPAGACLAAWLLVRLTFIPYVAALGPPSRPVLRTAWDLSEGRFWALLGRVVLLALVVVLPVLLASGIVSGVQLMAESPMVTAWCAVASTLLGAVASIVSGVGQVLLYAWLDGPVDEGADAP